MQDTICIDTASVSSHCASGLIFQIRNVVKYGHHTQEIIFIEEDILLIDTSQHHMVYADIRYFTQFPWHNYNLFHIFFSSGVRSLCCEMLCYEMLHYEFAFVLIVNVQLGSHPFERPVFTGSFKIGSK